MGAAPTPIERRGDNRFRRGNRAEAREERTFGLRTFPKFGLAPQKLRRHLWPMDSLRFSAPAARALLLVSGCRREESISTRDEAPKRMATGLQGTQDQSPLRLRRPAQFKPNTRLGFGFRTENLRP